MKMRLALRVEGDMWNAYAAQMGTMKGAFLIGSIAMGPIRANPDTKQRFMDLMQDVFRDTLKSATGADVSDFEVSRAPEHERSGRAS